MSEWKETAIGLIPKDWDLKTIDEIKSSEKKSIISGPFGSNISAKYFTPNGVPVVRGNNLSLELGVKFKDNGFVFITEEKANELSTWAKKDDIIFTAVGTIGQVGILLGNEKYSKYIISNKQLRIRINESIVEPLFAYYWFSCPQMTETIVQRNTGSSVPLINLSVLKSLYIPIPPKSIRLNIVKILSCLDDKIDLLHRQNKTLEQLAETLFRQWFVEEAEDSLGKRKLGDIALFYNGKSRPDDIEKSIIPIYGGNGILGYTDKSNFSGTSIIIGRVGAYCGSLYLENREIWITDNALLSKPKKDNYYYYLFYLLKSLNLNTMAEGSSHPLLTQTLLNSIEINIQSENKILSFDFQVKKF
jgi:type I restriction enzyme S subunit